jgi:simple sugar transport system ATP-binding protein
LGENGAGKSTLMKILFGLIEPGEGSVRVDGVERHWKNPGEAIEAGLGMVHQHFSLVETLSIIDNIMLGHETTSHFGRLDREAAIADLESLLPSESLRMNWHRTVSDLSVGEKQKVEILKLIARRSRILVLDEPTAVLSPSEIRELFSILKGLKQTGCTIFVITHKLDEVFEHCDTWCVLRAGRGLGTGELSETSVDQIVRLMVGGDSAAPREDIESFHAPPHTPAYSPHALEPALSFQNVSLRGVSRNLQEISFGIRPGQILGVAGVDGSGQAEIVSSILGLENHSGVISVLGESVESGAARQQRRLRQKGLAIVSEDRHRQGLWLDESVELNAGFGHEDLFSKRGLIAWGEWSRLVREWMAGFDVRYPSSKISVRRLSGGNQQKLIFAREMNGRSPRLLVAHQPTRGVDFAAVNLIHEKVLEAKRSGAAVLLISSELSELMKLSDQMIVLYAGRVAATLNRTPGEKPFDREAIGALMTGGGRP